MNRTRIGKDLTVRWSIFRRVNGKKEEYILAGKNLTLRLKTAFTTKDINDYLVEGNTIVWTFRGKDQVIVGTYSLILIENDGEHGMITIDKLDAFQLVAHTKNEVFDDGSDVVVDVVEMESVASLVPTMMDADEELSATSVNAVQNKAVTERFTQVSNEVSEDDFELGNISIGTTGWGYNDSRSRVRTKKGITYHLTRGCKIGLSDYSNARFYIGWKTESGYRSAGWLTDDFNVTEKGEYIVLICNKTDKEQTDKFALLNLLRIEGSLGVYRKELNEIKPFVKKIGVALVQAEDGIVNINTANKTIDFGSNTVLIIGTKYYTLEGKARAIPYYVEGKNSGAVYIVYNLTNDSIYPKVYTEAIEKDEVILGAVRSRYQTHEFISASFSWEYAVDGVGVREKMDSIASEVVNPFVKGVNHRGFNSLAPENTMPAFELSFKHGFKYVEADIRFTADNVGVLLHDPSIDSMSNGSGEINALTYAQVSQYDFGSKFSSEYAGTRIATLNEFLAFCRNKGIHPYLEIKGATKSQVESIVRSVSAYGMKGNVTYISFSLSHLQWVLENDDTARVGYLANTVSSTFIAEAISLRNGKNEVFADIAAHDSTSIEMCKEEGLPLELWTINSITVIENLDSYISGVTSDSHDFRKVALNK